MKLVFTFRYAILRGWLVIRISRNRKSGLFHGWFPACCGIVIFLIGSGHSAAQAGFPTLSCRLPSASVPVGGQAELFLEIQNVQNLYGYELVLRYDPALIDFVDADPLREGVNTQLSNFLSPDFLVLNEIDPPGELWLNLTQIDPTLARSGSSPLARALVTGRQDGIADFTITDLVLYDMAGNEIPYQIQNCALQVGTPPAPAATATPTLVPSTETPTQAPPTVAPADTFAPTAAPTATLVAPTEVQPTVVPPTIPPAVTSVPAAAPAPAPVPATEASSTATPIGASTAVPTATSAVATYGAPPIEPANAATNAPYLAATAMQTVSLPYISNGMYGQAPTPASTPTDAAVTASTPIAATSTAGEQVILPLVAGGSAPPTTTPMPQAAAVLGTPAPIAQQPPVLPTMPRPVITLAWLFPLGFTIAGLGFLGLAIAMMVYVSSRPT